MKKNYLKNLVVLLLFGNSAQFLNAQCTAPPAPSVSGGTIAGCVSSANFTLTATPNGTNVVGWYANPYGGNALSTNSVFTTPTLTGAATYYVGQSTRTSLNDSVFMPAYNNNVAAQETRGYYFTAPHDFIITGLRVPVAIGGTVSGIAVIKLPIAPPLYTSVTNTFSTLYLNQTITGTNVVAVNIPVYAGDIIGVLGERDNYSAYGVNGGTGTYASTMGIGGTAVTLNRMGMLFNLATTAPQDLWTETVNTIGIVEMYISKGCNSPLKQVNVNVVPVPQVTVIPPPKICANSSYTLNAGGALTFTWTNGPQTSSYVVNPSSTTTYSVKGSIQSNCTTSLTTVTISVDPGVPTLTTLSSSNPVCSGNTLVLSGAGAATYTWAGGANSVTDNIAFVPIATQQYTLYGTNSCGTSSKLITVTVNPTPTLITAVTPTAVCEGHTATLSVTGASTYSWEAATSLGSTFVITPTVSGAYNVTGTTSAGCPGSGSQYITLNPVPLITAGAVGGKTLVCSGGSATLTSSGADTYSWTSGAQTYTDIVNPMSTQVYTVTGTYTSTQCYSEKAVTINVFSPAVSISSDMTVCKGAAVTLTADAGANATYVWSTGSLFYYAPITASIPSTYIVTAQSTTLNGVKCSNTASVQVFIHPDPTVHVVSTRTAICRGEKTILTASGGTIYSWSNLTAKTATVQVNPIDLNNPTTYSVTGTDINGCNGNAAISVKVSACTGINEFNSEAFLVSVYPNPNNGTFVVQTKSGIQLTLLNELGQEIRQLNFTEENQFQETVEGLSTGIYFIRGMHDGMPVQNKLVVTK